MEYSTEILDGVAILRPRGRLDASQAEGFKRHFEARPEAMTMVVLDLEGVDFIDSTGLGAIVACLKRVSELGGDIKVCGLNAKTRMIFEITRAHRVFDIFDDAKSAAAAFRTPA